VEAPIPHANKILIIISFSFLFFVLQVLYVMILGYSAQEIKHTSFRQDGNTGRLPPCRKISYIHVQKSGIHGIV
jgi:hypothetical protein